MEKIFVIKGTNLTIHMPKELDHHNAEEIKREADRLLGTRNIRSIIFDFEKTSFMDSSGIGLAMGRYNKVKDLAGSIVIVPGSPYVSRVLGLSGLFGLIPKTSSKRSALEYIYEKGGKGNETGKLV